jgi:hypothetical protein
VAFRQVIFYAKVTAEIASILIKINVLTNVLKGYNYQQQTTVGNTKPTSAKRIIGVHLFEIIAMEHFIR